MSEIKKRLEILMSHDDEKYWKWVSACMDIIDEIDNEFENRFICDIYLKLEKSRSYFLTPRQVEILERIYAERTK